MTSYQDRIWLERAGIIEKDLEELNELSKKTLKSYVKKSEPQAISSIAAAQDKVEKHIERTGKAPSSEKQVMKIAGKEIMHAAKRTKGLERAAARMEEVEQLEEKVLDDLGTTIGYTVSSKVHQHPDEEHYNTNTLIHKGSINGKKFEAHQHINHGISFKTKHTDAEVSAIKNHLKKNKYL